MKRFILTVAAVLTLPLFVRADLTITNEIQNGGQTQEMTMKLKNGAARVEMGSAMTVLFNSETGDSTVLMHEQKKAMTIPGSSLQGMIEQMTKQQGVDPSAAPPQLKPNGKTETINGFKTEGYTYSQGGTEVEYFLAKDFPDLKGTLAQLNAFQKSGVNKLNAASLQVDLTTFPGFPIRTVVQSQGTTIVSTVKKIERAEIPAAEFEMPTGYETMNVPMTPGVSP